MLNGLIAGTIWRAPETKVSNAGKTFGVASVRVMANDTTIWFRLFTFSETAIAELMSLKDGEGIAASGSLKVEIYDRGSGPRLSYTLFADRLISAKRQKRERDQERRDARRRGPIDATEAQRPIDNGLNDDLPEGWS